MKKSKLLPLSLCAILLCSAQPKMAQAGLDDSIAEAMAIASTVKTVATVVACGLPALAILRFLRYRTVPGVLNGILSLGGGALCYAKFANAAQASAVDSGFANLLSVLKIDPASGEAEDLAQDLAAGASASEIIERYVADPQVRANARAALGAIQ